MKEHPKANGGPEERDSVRGGRARKLLQQNALRCICRGMDCSVCAGMMPAVNMGDAPVDSGGRQRYWLSAMYSRRPHVLQNMGWPARTCITICGGSET